MHSGTEPGPLAYAQYGCETQLLIQDIFLHFRRINFVEELWTKEMRRSGGKVPEKLLRATEARFVVCKSR